MNVKGFCLWASDYPKPNDAHYIVISSDEMPDGKVLVLPISSIKENKYHDNSCELSIESIKDENDLTYVNYDYYMNELNKNTPLIIWTKDKLVSGQIDYFMGMIDVMPTLGNMLGVYNKYALGHDIFEIKDDNIVVFSNGNFLTNKLYYNNSKGEYKVFSDEIIEQNYIEEFRIYAEKLLEVSNDLIVYDLKKRVEEK